MKIPASSDVSSSAEKSDQTLMRLRCAGRSKNSVTKRKDIILNLKQSLLSIEYLNPTQPVTDSDRPIPALDKILCSRDISVAYSMAGTNVMLQLYHEILSV